MNYPCYTCKKLLEPSAFNKNKLKVTRGGLSTMCRKCVSDYHKTRRKEGNYRQEYMKQYWGDNPEKRNAHVKVHYHLKRGHITKSPCEKCGDIKSEGHHEDYDKPLDVVWLCHSCHMTLHRS